MIAGGTASNNDVRRSLTRHRHTPITRLRALTAAYGLYVESGKHVEACEGYFSLFLLAGVRKSGRMKPVTKPQTLI